MKRLKVDEHKKKNDCFTCVSNFSIYSNLSFLFKPHYKS